MKRILTHLKQNVFKIYPADIRSTLHTYSVRNDFTGFIKAAFTE